MNTHITVHVQRRMSQRGISKKMIDFVIDHGEIKGERFTCDRDLAREQLSEIDLHIRELQKERKTLMKILDKGGVTVVSDNGKAITAFNITQ